MKQDKSEIYHALNSPYKIISDYAFRIAVAFFLINILLISYYLTQSVHTVANYDQYVPKGIRAIDAAVSYLGSIGNNDRAILVRNCYGLSWIGFLFLFPFVLFLGITQGINVLVREKTDFSKYPQTIRNLSLRQHLIGVFYCTFLIGYAFFETYYGLYKFGQFSISHNHVDNRDIDLFRIAFFHSVAIMFLGIWLATLFSLISLVKFLRN